MRRYVVGLGCLLATASAVAGPPSLELRQALARADAYPFGSRDNPVRTNGAAGQRAYLDRLRCADGSAPDYTRAGNDGSGPYASILDLYLLDCGRAAPGRAEVRMDGSFAGYVEKRAIPGFTIAGR